MKKSILVLSMLIGFSAIIFNSCSKSDTPATPVVTVAPPAVAGSWSRSNGTAIFSLVLNNDYSYSSSMSGAPIESGTYAIADTSITFNSTAGSSGCIGKPGKYGYTIIGTVLRFKMMSDSCVARYAGVIPGDWNKK
ncbi:MAG: hypothetical protein WCO28_08520 [Bacteroidota bacterium]